MLVSCPAAAREADPAGMSSGEPSATTPMGGLLLNPVLTFYLFWLVPAFQARPPAAHVPTIRLILSTKFLAERRFFVQDDEQMHAESNCCDGGNREQAGVSEDDPQPDPARGKADVHGIAHVTIEAYNNQALRRRDRRRRPVSSPTKIPNATQGNCESQHRWQGGEPTPMSCTRLDVEPKPLGQEPEPQ